MRAINPYVLSVIRLADRRGLLRGRRISSVQKWAIEVMMLWEDATKRSERLQTIADNLRLHALFSLSEEERASRFGEFYPEFAQVDNVTEEDLEDTEGEWIFKERMDPADIEAVLAEIGTEGLTVELVSSEWQ